MSANLRIHELRYLVALARELHFGRAAQQCQVSQPTLSIALRKLEQGFGVVLFERNKRSVQLTPAGQRIVERAQAVLDQFNALEDFARAQDEHIETPFRIGAIYTIGPYLFPKLVRHMNSTAPEMRLYIEEGFTDSLRPKLANGELDAVVLSLPFNEPNVVTRTVYNEAFSVIMPSKHPLEKKQSITDNDLAEYNCLLLNKGHCFREQVLNACPKMSHAIEKPILSEASSEQIEGGSIETLRYMVASGMGLSVLPNTAVTDMHNPLISVRPLRAEQAQREVALAWRASFPRYRAIDEVLNALDSIAPLTTND